MQARRQGLDLRSYMIALSGIICVSFAEGVFWIGLLLGGILTWGYWSSAVEGKCPVSNAMEKKLMVGAFLLSAAEFLARGMGREAVIFSLGHTLALAQCVNAFKNRNATDYANVLTVGAAHLLLAVSFPPMLFTMVYLVGFILFLPGSLFRLANLRLLEEKSVCAQTRSRLVLWPFVVPFIILIFVIMPRNQNYVRWDLPGQWGISGLSSRLSIGRFSTIVQSNEVVMRVKATFPSKWRAMSYDVYRDGEWTVSTPTRTPFRSNRPQRDGKRSLPKDALLLEQSYWIERPVPDRMLCAVPEVLGIWTDSGALVQADKLGNLYWYEGTRSGFRYNVESAVKRPPPQSLRKDHGGISPPLRNRYTQVPSMTPEVRKLALRITQSAGTVYDKAVAIEQYLSSQYSYSTSPGNGTERGDPVEWFLFQSKKGYCEQFATSMAILLRSIGIPSRVVSGFLPGEMVFGGYHVVRSRDAHAWVEVYFPSHGWVSFDPTPAAASLGPFSKMAMWAGTQWDLLKLRWFRYVVNFSNWNQERIRAWAQEIRDRFLTKMRAMALGFRGTEWNLKPGWVVGLLLLLGFTGGFLVRRGGMWFTQCLGLLGGILPFQGRVGRKKIDSEAAVLFYRRMLNLLKGKGHERRASQGPWEFEQSLSSFRDEVRKEVRTVTEVYCEVRFGKRSLDEARLARVKGSLDRLKRELKEDRET